MSAAGSWPVVWGLDYDIRPTTAEPGEPLAGGTASYILADIARFQAELEERFPPAGPAALEQASFLGLFALSVPCCAGADGLRIRVVALEPVSPLDLGIARMKLARWYPAEAEVIELATAGCWG